MALANITEEEWADFLKRYEKVREDEEIYRVALALTNHTITVIDIPNRTLNQMHNKGDWSGVAKSMPNAPESIIAAGLVHPDEADAYRQFFVDVYAGKPSNECTFRLKEDERGWVWYTMHAQTIFDEDKKPLKAIAFSDDITSRKKAEMMYDQYRSAVTNNATYVWEIDLDKNKIIEEDGESEKLFSHTGGESYTDIIAATTEKVPEVYREKVREIFSIENLLNEFKQAKREVTLTYPFKSEKEQRDIWFQSTAYLTTMSDGHINAIICIRDVTERKREEDLLRKAAERDSLCGLYNRKAFEERVSNVLNNDRRARGGHMFMIDIDDFKEYNDQYGHIVGDEIIQCISDVLRSSFRDYDILARFGGDEFMAFATNFDAEAAIIRAEDIERTLETTERLRNLDRPVTLSIGIAEARTMDDFQSLYKKADDALYRAKTSGKGCCALWEN